jgi:hypothetical protein
MQFTATFTRHSVLTVREARRVAPMRHRFGSVQHISRNISLTSEVAGERPIANINAATLYVLKNGLYFSSAHRFF